MIDIPKFTGHFNGSWDFENACGVSWAFTFSQDILYLLGSCQWKMGVEFNEHALKFLVSLCIYMTSSKSLFKFKMLDFDLETLILIPLCDYWFALWNLWL